MGLVSSLKKRGPLGTIQYGLQKKLGIIKLQEEIDTLHYYLNSYEDITCLKPTDDVDLRKMQFALLNLLRIFDKLCKQNGLTYFLGGGNFLGAVRHHGFIPWDDDLDVIMPREDYDKVIPLFKERLSEYGIIVGWKGHYDNEGYLSRLFLDYKTLETGVWMDILPIDYCNAKGKLSEVREDLKRAIEDYRKYYLNAQYKDSIETILQNKKRIFGKYDSLNNGNHKVYYRSCEFTDVEIYNDEETIYPLQECEFEGYKFPIPNDPYSYLTGFYGDYMRFPRSIVLHKDPDGTKASERAPKHGIDMNDVINYLDKVYEQI